MELVAASKMKKSVDLTLASRTYAQTIRTLVDEIMHLVDPTTHAMLIGKRGTSNAERGALHTLVIVCSSDRGLCGSFNAQAIRTTLEFLKTRAHDQIHLVTVGKRAERACKRAGYEIKASFEAISNAPGYERTRPIGDLVVREFVYHEADRVFIVFTDYKSALRQVPTVEQLLPIIPEEGMIKTKAPDQKSDITFEPDPERVLNELLPRLVEMRIYQALLESSASEHSARMLAMRSATDNAGDILGALTLMYNRARQASITQEISEISAGKAALE